MIDPETDAPPLPPAPAAEHASLGVQWLIECHDADPRVLDDPVRLEAALLSAARASGATVLGSHFHTFEPQGVSGVVLIAESHFTVHSWPEHRYAAVDAFSCSERVRVEAAIEVLSSALSAGDVTASARLQRGVIGPRGVERARPFPSGISRSLSLRARFDADGGAGLLVAVDVWGCEPEGLSAEGARARLSALGDALGFRPAGEGWSQRSGGGEGWVVEPFEGLLIAARLSEARGSAHVDLRADRFVEPEAAALLVRKAFGGEGHSLVPIVRR